MYVYWLCLIIYIIIYIDLNQILLFANNLVTASFQIYIIPKSTDLSNAWTINEPHLSKQ